MDVSGPVFVPFGPISLVTATQKMGPRKFFIFKTLYQFLPLFSIQSRFFSIKVLRKEFLYKCIVVYRYYTQYDS